MSAPRLERLAERLAYRGRGVATWVDGPIGLAQIGARTDGARAIVEASDDGFWRIVFDGRLDNRTDLARALGLNAVARDGSDDARIARLACEAWGLDAAGKMIGDFAGAVWNARARELWLMRDVFGVRPLYYRLTARECVCASDLRTLLLDSPAAINEGVVAECLSGAVITNRETLYQGVVRLPMAHIAVVSATSQRDWQYWTPNPNDTLSDRSPDDRAARFAALFAEAVDVRRAGASPTALMLSGGLDSSCIAACLAESPDARWQGYTLAQVRAEDDESPIAKAVANHFHAPHISVLPRPLEPQEFADDTAFTLDLPGLPNGLQGLQLRERIVADGFPVALSGLGSDEWFGGSFLMYADLARRGALIELARTVWADRNRADPTRIHLRIAAWSLCPPVVKSAVRAALRRTSTAPWIHRDLCRRTSLADRLRARDIPIPAFPSLSQRSLYADNTSGDYAYSMEHQERANARLGLDERYPFHDRRLIEFSLALPETDRWAPGRSKTIIRRAMASRLPPSVIERTASPDASPVVEAALFAVGGRRFFEQLTIAEEGWVDLDSVRLLWDRVEHQARAGQRVGREAWELWTIASVELWWRHTSVTRQRDTAPDPAAVTR